MHGNIITEFIGLKPKLYSFTSDDSHDDPDTPFRIQESKGCAQAQSQTSFELWELPKDTARQRKRNKYSLTQSGRINDSYSVLRAINKVYQIQTIQGIT